MNEDELRTSGGDVDEDAILPSGWSATDDIFADPSTWSGSTSQEAHDDAAATSTEQQDSATGEAHDPALTMGTEVDDPVQSADKGNDENPTGQSEDPAPKSRILPLVVNHNDAFSVDVNKMSNEELIERLQKSYAFDQIKKDQLKDKYRTVYEEQISEGYNDAVARMVAANECGGQSFDLEDDPDSAASESDPAPAASPSVRDIAAEVEQVKCLFPDFSGISSEVARAVDMGTPLLTAYVADRERQREKAAESLRKENEILKQNASAASRAPVRGVSGGGSVTANKNAEITAGFDKGYY